VATGELGRPMAVSRGDWVYRGTPVFSEDWYFGLRVPRFDPAPDGYTTLERDVLGIWRWWPPSELAAPAEVVIPPALDAVVALVLAGDTPDRGDAPDRPVGGPMVLPWRAL
jgi:hypothetical protein